MSRPEPEGWRARTEKAMRTRLYAPSMVQMVLHWAEAKPDHLCTADPEESFTYAEMKSRILGKAAALEGQVHRGTRVLARARQRGDFLALQLAVHALGGIFIPVSTDTPQARLGELAETLQADLVLPEGRVTGRSGTARLALPQPEDTATILYTTGTTGRSKGIVLSHRAEVAVAQNVFYGTQMEEDTVELIPLPISHSYGLRHCLGLLLGGRTIVLSDGVSLPGDMYALMDRYGVNALSLTPATVNVLLRFALAGLEARAGQIRYLQLGTAGVDSVMKAEMRRLFPAARLYQYYSSTEAGCACIFDYREDMHPRRVGRAAVNAHFEIWDEAGKAIESDERHWGYIACRGLMNMEGYDRDQVLTAQTLRDGFVLSRDLGYLDDEGYLNFVGRDGEVISTGGFKVAPEEVEEAAMRSGLLLECACCGAGDSLLGQVPVLYAVSRSGDVRNELRVFLSAVLEDYKVPRRIIMIRAVPRNAMGKPMRRKCLELEEER